MPDTICSTSPTEYGLPRDGQLTEALLARIARGDTQALAQLYHGTRSAVYGFALAIVKDCHDAEDILQEVYVRIYGNAGQYRAHGKPMAWIFAITRNLSLMRLREHRRRGELSEEGWQQLPDKVSGLPPEEQMALQAAMDTLADGERQIVMLHALSGLKHREIAHILDMALPTVLSQYHRALKKLRQKLTEE